MLFSSSLTVQFSNLTNLQENCPTTGKYGQSAPTKTANCLKPAKSFMQKSAVHRLLFEYGTSWKIQNSVKDYIKKTKNQTRCVFSTWCFKHLELSTNWNVKKCCLDPGNKTDHGVLRPWEAAPVHPLVLGSKINNQLLAYHSSIWFSVFQRKEVTNKTQHWHY